MMMIKGNKWCQVIAIISLLSSFLTAFLVSLGRKVSSVLHILSPNSKCYLSICACLQANDSISVGSSNLVSYTKKKNTKQKKINKAILSPILEVGNGSAGSVLVRVNAYLPHLTPTQPLHLTYPVRGWDMRYQIHL